MPQSKPALAVGYACIAPACDVADLDVQRRRITQACSALCLELGELITDESSQRPNLARAMAQAQAGPAVLIVCNLSRLADSVVQLLALCHQLARDQTQLISLDEDVNTTTPVLPGQPGFFNLMAAMERLEQEHLAHAMPYGFRVATDLTHYVIDESEQDLIRQMVQWRFDGVEPQAIAQRLNQQGRLWRQNRDWNAQAVQTILDQAVTSRWIFPDETP